jgi:hypothetical protein
MKKLKLSKSAQRPAVTGLMTELLKSARLVDEIAERSWETEFILDPATYELLKTEARKTLESLLQLEKLLAS